VSPLVDAVIAVHDPSRPVERAVASLTRSGLRLGDELRITVVCHNLPLAPVEERLSRFDPAGVRCLPLADGIRSPAGPFNAGIEAASARYVSILGSDDFHEDGALAAWLANTEGGEIGAVIAPEAHATGATVRTPPVRPFHRGDRDGVKDRLAYRTAPLGLISRATIERLSLRFTAGLLSGEDQAFSTRLWFGSDRIRYAKGAPRYLVGADAETRVSSTPAPLEAQFGFTEALLGSDWFRVLGAEQRRAIAVKLMRVHVFASVGARIREPGLSTDEREFAAALVDRLRQAAPGFERALSLADRRTVDALTASAFDEESLVRALEARRRFGRPSTLVTRDLRGLLQRDGPLRFMAASALM
jgi:hypothetical protein